MDFKHEDSRIALYSMDGTVLAEVDFPEIDSDTVNVSHTFVDDSLRGQGIAGKLMEELVDDLRRSGKKATLTCSYAVSWFEKHTECADVLAQTSL